MEVILVKPVRKVGKIGELIRVKNGFARNYLLPKNIAIRATEANKQLIEKKKAEFEVSNAQLKLEAESIAKIITDKELTFIKQCSDDGRLFGSVTNKEIALALSDLISHNIPYSNILIEAQIKSLSFILLSISLIAAELDSRPKNT